MTSIRTLNELMESYKNFKKEPPKNIVTRLYEELTIVRSIISTAQAQKPDFDTFELQKIADNNLKQLHEMGYKKLI